MDRSPISGLHRELGGLANLLVVRVAAADGLALGGRRPVLLVPGFGATDVSTRVLASRLRELGYTTASARIGMNVRCGEVAATRLINRLEAVAGEYGQRVAIVGHSRGGHLARVAALRRPDLVSGIVTLGTPELRLASVRPAVRVVAVMLGLAGSAGVPGPFKLSCMTDSRCCERFRAEQRAAFPDAVGFVAIWSRRDALIDWRRISERDARRVEVAASHVGMLTDPDTFRAIACALAGFADKGSSGPVPCDNGGTAEAA